MTMLLDQRQIAQRIPHAGSMCLLHAVTAWDENAIEARAISHRDTQNPLRCAQGLGISAGIEYAAQAIAVHGNLAGGQGAARSGRLASTRSIRCHIRWLHLIDGELAVKARRIMGDDAMLVYEFELSSPGQILLTGRASIALMNS